MKSGFLRAVCWCAACFGLPPSPSAADGPKGPPTKPDTEKRWAFELVKKIEPPAGPSGWPANPIDRFVLAKLRERGLQPAGPADKRTLLLRRVTYDLTGLPPTPEEVAAFLADGGPSAFAKVVDRLLASPQYGERWGRHWLDVARYSDTSGAAFLGLTFGCAPAATTTPTASPAGWRAGG